jgi:hypothetical protein
MSRPLFGESDALRDLTEGDDAEKEPFLVMAVHPNSGPLDPRLPL